MKDLRNFIIPNMISEGVSMSMFEKYISTIQSYITKYKLFMTKNPSNIVVDGKSYFYIYVFSIDKNNGCNIMWEVSGNHNYVHSLAFTKDHNKFYNTILNGGKFKFDVIAELKDMSLANLLPFIVKTLNDNKINTKDISSELYDLVRKYGMYENVDTDSPNMITEGELENLRKERNKLSVKIHYSKSHGHDVSELESRLEELRRLIAEKSYSVKGNVSANISHGVFADVVKQEEEYLLKATPEERFSDMEHYISMVIKGLQPSLLICGAPGVGKTFRVMKAIKASGLNYKVIKGKETAMACYCDLFLYSREGDILIFDDADDVLENEVITNLLKAATDSSDERIVSYGTSKPPMMTQEEFMSLPLDLQNQCSIQEIKGGQVYFYPKNFETKGRVLIITNKNAGQIDTAVRNRGLVCDLAFTTEECLEIIEGLLPHIMPGKLSQPAKVKALDYLQNLANKGSKMEISIRSFTTVAKVYEDVDDESQAERMIREQMYLQSLRGGKKY